MASDEADAKPRKRERPLHAGHRERLRERFLAAPDAVHDYEVLELILFGAIPMKDVKPLAKRLIAEFGSLAEVIAAPTERLIGVAEGGVRVSESAAGLLKAVHVASQRLARTGAMKKPVISSWSALLDYCTTAMARDPREQFRVLFLDKKNRLIADEVMSRGTVDHAPVYPREIVKRALDLHASAMILVHNHPSGDPSPSRDDIAMTREIAAAAKPLGVAVHDHLVIGRAGHASFKALGLL